jgi:hypothetical protein
VVPVTQLDVTWLPPWTQQTCDGAVHVTWPHATADPPASLVAASLAGASFVAASLLPAEAASWSPASAVVAPGPSALPSTPPPSLAGPPAAPASLPSPTVPNVPPQPIAARHVRVQRIERFISSPEIGARLPVTTFSIAMALLRFLHPATPSPSQCVRTRRCLMSCRIATLGALTLALSAAACGSAPTSTPAPAASSQILRGTVALSSYALDNPIIVARASDGRAFRTAVHADGTFALTVPSGAALRLAIANTTAAGGYVAISRILWPGVDAAWARLDGTEPAVVLGAVHPAGPTGVRTLDHGGWYGSGSGDGEHEGDAGEGHDDHGGMHACSTEAGGYGSDDDCECDGTEVCSAPDESDSDCDGSSGSVHADDSDDGHGDDGKCADGSAAPPPSGGQDAGGAPGNPGGGGASGAPCKVSADCSAPLVCIASSCSPPTK